MKYVVEITKRRGKWTATYRASNGEIVLTSSSQRYSRRKDAVDEQRKILAAAKAGRVRFKIGGLIQ